MPRESRASSKTVAVIPSNSLVASAVRYAGTAPRIYRPHLDWQRECYRHYAICGEARFAATFYAHAMSRAVLFAATPGDRGPVRQTSGTSAELVAELFNGKDGQAQMLKSIGLHLTIAGELYLVGREVNGHDTWEVVSVLEMQVDGTRWSINYGDGMQPVPLSEKDVVIRIWNPAPDKRIEADSPFRSMLPILSEIEWLTLHIFAQASSRLAGAGIYWVPQEMDFPPPPVGSDGKVPVNLSKAEGLMMVLADTMMAVKEDQGNPASQVPIVITAPGEHIDKAKLQHFWSDLDAKALEMRVAAISRFADGMDLPREQVLGMSSNPGTGGGNSNGVSHWGAWQIDESTIKMFVEPSLETVCNALTIGYLRPLLVEGATDLFYYDTSALRLRPDRSGEAMELYDRGVLSREALLRETGFDVSDLPDDGEYKEWLLRKVASGSATPEMVAIALKMLGVDLGPIEKTDEAPNEARPDPSLEDLPLPQEPPEFPQAAALLAASDALVWRALERAGNRIRQSAGIKPPGVPAYEMHTLVQVNGSADQYLDDAWSCAEQVLDEIEGVDSLRAINVLNAYCRSLFAEQAPHSRARLERWLEVR